MEMRPILPRGSANTLRRAGTLAIAAVVGRESLDRRIAQLRPLRAALGGEIVLIDDGTLAGADRVRLARAFSDPELLQAPAGNATGTVLRAALDGRRNAYWLMVGGTGPLDALLPYLTRAIAANRSLARLGETPAELAPHLAALADDGWPYLPVAPDVIGLAAGGDGVPLATALRARLEAAAMHEPAITSAIPGFVLARERDAVLL